MRHLSQIIGLHFVCAAAVLAASCMPARAAGDSPYDAYYKQQEAGQISAPAAPIDNDQYYTAPGQYIDTKNYSSSGQYVPQTGEKSKGCTTISDSPECLGD